MSEMQPPPHIPPPSAPMQSVMSLNPTMKVKRPRLKTEGLLIMEGYWHRGIIKPNLIERTKMLNEIQAIPGCEGYQMTYLNSWFYRRRAKLKVSQVQDAKQDRLAPSPLYPSLTAEALIPLGTLSAAQPHPSPDVITTWAALLLADKKDVATWLHHHCSPTPNRSALPTPEPTVSPALFPSNLETMEFDEDPVESPAASSILDAKSEPPSPMLDMSGLISPQSPEYPPDAIAASPVVQEAFHPYSQAPAPPEPFRIMLLRALTQATSSTSPGISPSPESIHTAEQFKAMFPSDEVLLQTARTLESLVASQQQL